MSIFFPQTSGAAEREASASPAPSSMPELESSFDEAEGNVTCDPPGEVDVELFLEPWSGNDTPEPGKLYVLGLLEGHVCSSLTDSLPLLGNDGAL